MYMSVVCLLNETAVFVSDIIGLDWMVQNLPAFANYEVTNVDVYTKPKVLFYCENLFIAELQRAKHHG